MVTPSFYPDRTTFSIDNNRWLYYRAFTDMNILFAKNLGPIPH